MKFPNLFRRDCQSSPAQPSSTDSLRRRLVDQHGDLLGRVLFDSHIAARNESTARLTELQTRLDEANSALAAEDDRLNARLVPLQTQKDQAYRVFIQACEAYDIERVRIQQRLAPLQQRVYDVQAEIRGPQLHADKVTNWQRPGWILPESGQK